MKTLHTLLPFFFALSIAATRCDNLTVAYHWSILDFEYPTEYERQIEIEEKIYIPENNLPLGLEVYKDRLFVTIPRWKDGVAASLAYFNMAEDPPNTDPTGVPRSPKLRPYPNWAAHRRNLDDDPEIVSPFRIRADACGRLWVLDSGSENLLGNFTVVVPPTLLIYDLHNDQLLRKYVIPKDQRTDNSFFANVAVEDQNCQDSYAYLADISSPALVVYSFKNNESWKVRHHFFNIDPLAGEMTVANITFTWADGIFGLALSASDEEGYSTLYFHPMIGFDEFSVSTKVLRDKNQITEEPLSKDVFDKFKRLGTRGPKAQSGASFLDKKTGVLFYALVQLNAVACWRTTTAYTMESQGRIYMNDTWMIFPNDIKVDTNDNLWVLSDELPVFMEDPERMKEEGINYRIWTAKVRDAIHGTTCNESLVLSPKIMTKLSTKLNGSIIMPGRSKTTGASASSGITNGAVGAISLLLCAMLGLVK